MIEIYNECKEEKTTLLQPKLKLIVEGKNIRIHAVDENGTTLALIWNVSSTGTTSFYSAAKYVIQEKDDSTDWADWDSAGKFISLK